MICPRCESPLEFLIEHVDIEDECLIRDFICKKCNSAMIEIFFRDGRFKTDWIDLNV